jgi:hypothetical protein
VRKLSFQFLEVSIAFANANQAIGSFLKKESVFLKIKFQKFSNKDLKIKKRRLCFIGSTTSEILIQFLKLKIIQLKQVKQLTERAQ